MRVCTEDDISKGQVVTIFFLKSRARYWETIDHSEPTKWGAKWQASVESATLQERRLGIGFTLEIDEKSISNINQDGHTTFGEITIHGFKK